jgi:hypothetical protein
MVIFFEENPSYTTIPDFLSKKIAIDMYCNHTVPLVVNKITRASPY